MPLISAVMSLVAVAVCRARLLTSEATTAKPLPASPARAASIVALSARRLVLPAMFRMNSTTLSICSAASAKPSTASLTRAMPSTAPCVAAVDSETRLLISVIAAESCWLAEATVWTLTVVSSAAAATATLCSWVVVARVDMVVAVASISVAVAETVSITSETLEANVSATFSRRSLAAACAANRAFVSIDSRAVLIVAAPRRKLPSMPRSRNRRKNLSSLA
jgi:hypothetical protein